MGSTSACDNRKELKEIAKELHELNRKLDRLCRASIFSVDDPLIITKSGQCDEDSQEKQCL